MTRWSLRQEQHVIILEVKEYSFGVDSSQPANVRLIFTNWLILKFMENNKWCILIYTWRPELSFAGHRDKDI
jgi:hypothetical protein